MELSDRRARDGGSHRLSTPTVLWMVTASVVHFPLSLYVLNTTEVRAPFVHAAIWMALVGFALLTVFVCIRLGADRAVTTYTAMVVAVVFTAGNIVLSHLGAVLGSVFWGVVVLASGVIFSRLRHTTPLHALMFLAALFLTFSPLVPLVTDRTGDGVALEGIEIAYSGNGYLPDVVLVVLDGYPGIQFLDRLEGWDGAVVRALSDRGMAVRPAWASYSTTRLSLPSLFDVSHRVEPVDGVIPVLPQQLAPLIGGDGAVPRFLEQAGYTMTMVEPAWAGSQCGPRVDSCVEAPALDQVLFHALERTLFGPLFARMIGSPWRYTASRTVSWYEENLQDLTQNRQRDFVFAHVILPHPPFLLTEDCEMEYREEFATPFVRHTVPGLVEAQLRQMACVDQHLVQVADLVGPEALLIVVSDHGSELRSQVSRDTLSWTEEDIAERMSVLFAIRGPEDCHPTEPIMIPNIFRAVMRCMGTDIADLPPRMMLASALEDEEGLPYLAELDSGRVMDLIGAADATPED